MVAYLIQDIGNILAQRGPAGPRASGFVAGQCMVWHGGLGMCRGWGLLKHHFGGAISGNCKGVLVLGAELHGLVAQSSTRMHLLGSQFD